MIKNYFVMLNVLTGKNEFNEDATLSDFTYIT